MKKLSKNESHSVMTEMATVLGTQPLIDNSGAWIIEAPDGQWIRGNSESDRISTEFEYQLNPDSLVAFETALSAVQP